MRLLAILLLVGCGPSRPEGEGEGDGETEGGEDEDGHGHAGGEEDSAEARTRPSEMLERLRAAGLDPANLPPLSELSLEQKQNGIMPAFARSLGVQCRFCHVQGNYAAPTEHRHVTQVMYDRFVRALKHEDGSPVFCDSCHAGQAEFLPEGDRGVINRFMRKNYVQPLERLDGDDHGCPTCHGEPPVWEFLPDDAA